MNVIFNAPGIGITAGSLLGGITVTRNINAIAYVPTGPYQWRAVYFNFFAVPPNNSILTLPVGTTVTITGVTLDPSYNGTWTIQQQPTFDVISGYIQVVIFGIVGGTEPATVASGSFTGVPIPKTYLQITTNPSAQSTNAKFGVGTVSIIGNAVAPVPSNGHNFGVGQPFIRTQANFQSSSAYRRWSTVSYNRQVFFTNDYNPIAFTDGVSVFQYANLQPSARYMEVFFDHLVLGWPTWNGTPHPTRVQWSDLYNLNIWRPNPKNESDSYDITEWSRSDFPIEGCTGLGKLGNLLWVYTPTAIVSCRYVGRMMPPTFGSTLTGGMGTSHGPIMMFGDKVIRDVGNTLMYGLVCYKDAHYFWDGLEQDFYRFDGEKVESIGIKIKGYFLSSINASWPLFQATWGYTRPGRQEIVWVFVSNRQTTLVFDKAVVFNWKTGRWYTQSVENLHSYIGPMISADTADDLPGTADQLVGTADQLGVNTNPSTPIWGLGGGGFVRESIDSDPDVALLSQDVPTLETKDYGYDDLEHIKEADSIVIHANDRYANGVDVSLSVRDNVDDPVVYPDTTTYTYDPDTKRFGLPRKAGRLLRYKFQPHQVAGKPTRGFVWSGFVENVNRKVDDV